MEDFPLGVLACVSDERKAAGESDSACGRPKGGWLLNGD